MNGIPPARDITVSAFSTCAVSVDDVTYCWEANDFAQLGSGNLTGTAVPTPILSNEHYTSVSAGIIQTCATTTDGRAMCWGNNSFGQLGVPRPGEHCGDQALECSTAPIGVFGQQQFTSVYGTGQPLVWGNDRQRVALLGAWLGRSAWGWICS